LEMRYSQSVVFPVPGVPVIRMFGSERVILSI
jgi:hypothetical protein